MSKIVSIKRFLFGIERALGRIIFHHVWLISDRGAFAGDNGEAFFRFLQDKPVNSVFAISRHSKDYKRLSKIGKVVDYESILYKLLLCISDCHCSSHLIHMENHEETPQIFLQHGVAVSSLHKMLNPASHKNFYICTSSEKERAEMCSEKFTIDPEHVWLTGIPRFDYLRNKPEKIVVLAFTWRAYLHKLPKKEAVASEYFREIVRIVEDEELNRYLENAGYRLYIKLHPEMASFMDVLPQTVKDREYKGSYKKMFRKAQFLITDYSSTAFDFAYLGKPVVYYQFDKESFFDDNPYLEKGTFDFETDGFGPVSYDYDSLKKNIKTLIQGDCKGLPEYQDRSSQFFAFTDRNNCERVYEKICGIIGQK